MSRKVRHALRVFIPLIVIIVFVNLYFSHSDSIEPATGYPIWMKDLSGRFTEQTSGLAFVGNAGDKKVFIAADDIGKMNRLSVNGNGDSPVMEIFPIAYSDEVKTLFSKFKKTDMEEICYDSAMKKIYLSIEGHEYSSNDPQIYRKKEGIYEITYNKDILTFDTILTIHRMSLPQEVYAHTYDNMGFEGFSFTADKFFIGLENLSPDGNNFSDSTILYILDRKSNELKSISTAKLHISTICGLYAADNFNLYGIDRNKKSMFYIRFNADYSVNKCVTREMNLCVPLHRDIDNVIGIAPESITFDHAGNIYVAIDPWLSYYKPDIAERKKLSQDEMKNFSDGVPILYKFRNELK